MTKKELLYKKWLDFDDYKENDYREVFNYEALYIDDIYRNTVFLNDIDFFESVEELNYNGYEVLEKIVQDIENVGVDYVAMFGLSMSTKKWKTFLRKHL